MTLKEVKMRFVSSEVALETNRTAANQTISNQQQWRRHPSAAPPPPRLLSPREPARADRRPASTCCATATSSIGRGEW